jgi:hypothetical protein
MSTNIGETNEATTLRSEDDDGEELFVIGTIFKMMQDDDGVYKESRNLIEIYNASDDAAKVLIDVVLRCVCGYCLPTLVRMTQDPSYAPGDGDDDAHQKAADTRVNAAIRARSYPTW